MSQIFNLKVKFCAVLCIQVSMSDSYFGTNIIPNKHVIWITTSIKNKNRKYFGSTFTVFMPTVVQYKSSAVPNMIITIFLPKM